MNGMDRAHRFIYINSFVMGGGDDEGRGSGSWRRGGWDGEWRGRGTGTRGAHLNISLTLNQN